MMTFGLAQTVWTFSVREPAPHSMTSDAPIKAARAVPGHAGWILPDAVDGSLCTRLTAEKRIFSNKH